MKCCFNPTGVCAHKFEIEIEDGIIKDILIDGGCKGNKQAVIALCKGRDAREIIRLLDGIQCGNKGTSCPDQLAHALSLALSE